MFFQQYYLACLSHASYLLGSEGIAAVVDPQRDVTIYLEEARKQGLAIRYIIETHLHADFVSGHRELAALSGAAIRIGRHAGAAFPHEPVRDGDEIAFGRCRLRFLETPGHSLDSITVLVTDLDRSPEPFAALTGDTLFIGDVGRPDLSKGKSAEEMARMLYRSLHDKILTLPDGVEVYPAHGAGSLCGKQLSNETRSTLGKERASNYALRIRDEDEFVSMVTSDLPERPDYFALDKEINRSGPVLLADLPPLPPLSSEELSDAAGRGAIVLDTRAAAEFAAGHVPASVNIGLAGQFAVWAGALLGLEARLVLVADDLARVDEARLRLARVGIENAAGFLDGGMAAWARAGMTSANTTQVPAGELRRTLLAEPDAVQVVDVRRPPEWDEGHIEGALSIPLASLPADLPRLDRSRPVAVYCKGGYRSAIAASLVERAGAEAWNVPGGFDAWRACGLPFSTGRESRSLHV